HHHLVAFVKPGYHLSHCPNFRSPLWQILEHGSCDLLTSPTSVQVTATDEGFIAAAKGNLDDDATCDEWSVNEQKEVRHLLDDTIN
ncbi:MAG: hypothetical protein K2Q17_17815, partial [Nitrospiraceae bacterium]|nr:hypothetical protein [Nitrospiraceae bacterium]